MPFVIKRTTLPNFKTASMMPNSIFETLSRLYLRTLPWEKLVSITNNRVEPSYLSGVLKGSLTGHNSVKTLICIFPTG